MKKLLMFFVGCMVVGFIGSLFITSMPAYEMVGKSFLLNLKQGNYQPAYSIFSDDYHQRQSLDSFKQTVMHYRLHQFKDVKWLKSVTRSDKVSGYLLGEVIVEGGQKVPLEFQFVRVTGSNVQRQGWFVDDMFIGPEVIERQVKGYQ